ncbi:hypothetical protein GCM10023334_102990 [Nonomuraea thailandensis]
MSDDIAAALTKPRIFPVGGIANLPRAKKKGRVNRTAPNTGERKGQPVAATGRSETPRPQPLKALSERNHV